MMFTNTNVKVTVNSIVSIIVVNNNSAVLRCAK